MFNLSFFLAPLLFLVFVFTQFFFPFQLFLYLFGPSLRALNTMPLNFASIPLVSDIAVIQSYIMTAEKNYGTFKEK